MTDYRWRHKWHYHDVINDVIPDDDAHLVDICEGYTLVYTLYVIGLVPIFLLDVYRLLPTWRVTKWYININFKHSNWDFTTIQFVYRDAEYMKLNVLFEICNGQQTRPCILNDTVQTKQYSYKDLINKWLISKTNRQTDKQQKLRRLNS